MNKEFSGIEKLSLVDYDNKTACTLFTSGCNFRCPFCHNAPLVTFQHNEIIPFEEILEYLNKRKGKLQAVVITGGEPTMMYGLIDKIRMIKALGYLVKLDTNGTSIKIIKELVENRLIDYIAMDIKNGESNYLNTIGINRLDFSRIKESIDYIMTCGIDYEFRTTLVEEFHSTKDIIEISELIKGANKYFLQHFVSRDTCINKELHEVPIDKANQYKELLINKGINTMLRGY